MSSNPDSGNAPGDNNKSYTQRNYEFRDYEAHNGSVVSYAQPLPTEHTGPLSYASDVEGPAGGGIEHPALNNTWVTGSALHLSGNNINAHQRHSAPAPTHTSKYDALRKQSKQDNTPKR